MNPNHATNTPFNDSTQDLLAAGTGVTPVLSAAPECFLPAPGNDIDDYLASVGTRRRADFLLEHRRVRKAAGIRFRPARLADEVTALAPLQLHALARHGSPRTLDDVAAELHALARHAGGRKKLIVAEEDGRPVGFGLWYVWGNRLWARNMALVDRLRTTATPILFHLMFRCSLEICYADGLDGVHLGLTSLATKLRRGARLEPLWHVSVRDGQEAMSADEVRRYTDGALALIAADCRQYAPTEQLAALRSKALAYAR